MKKQRIALLLSICVLFGSFGVFAFAAEGETGESQPQTDAAETAAPAETVLPAETVAPTEKPAPEATETPEETADPAGTLTFSGLRQRVLTKNYRALALAESIAILDEIDYKKVENQIRDGLNQIANQQYQLSTSGSNAQMDQLMTMVGGIAGNPPTIPGTGSAEEQILAGAILALNAGMKALQNGFVQSQNMALQSQYDTLNEQLEDVKNGKLQEDNDGVKKQLQSVQEQLVGGAETLYITLLDLECSDAGLTRSLNALDRQIAALQLRYEMGQISYLQLQQIMAGRSQLASGQETVRMNLQLLRMQLNNLIGEDAGAVFALQPVEAVSADTLAAIEPEKDLLKAKEVSYEIYALNQEKKKAQEDYDEAVKQYGVNSTSMEFSQAKHNWQAAQYTYNAGIQDFDTNFHTLYLQMMDAAQVIRSKQTDLSVKQAEYSAAATKYQQGSISAITLREAEDAVGEASDAVSAAQHDLFTKYNSYCRAVRCGILN